MLKRFATYCLLLISSLALAASGEVTLQVECGTWVEIEATPYQNYFFAGWSDGNQEPKRLVQVNEDMVYIAFFDTYCGMGADLPVVARYDWLLMINAKAVREMGYTVTDNLVTWYKIVGEPDDITDINGPHDDIIMCTGLYLTIDQNLGGTGDYYYVLDVGAQNAGLCTGRMRSQIVHYASTMQPTRTLALYPTLTKQGSPIKVTGLNPDTKTELRIYTITGKRMAELTSLGEEECWLDQTTHVPGCYEVVIYEDGETTVLRYLVQ